MKVRPQSGILIDVERIFNKVEDLWGSNNLLAIVVYGSSVYPRYETKIKKRKFLGFQWEKEITKIIPPNDVDIAAIYTSMNVENFFEPDTIGTGIVFEKCDECIPQKLVHEEYSCYWEDIKRDLDLHLMCITYNSLIVNKNDPNLKAVLDGKIIWGNLPRPMQKLNLCHA